MERVLFFVITAFLLTACGGSKSSAPADDSADTETVAADSVAAEIPQYDATEAISMGLNGHVQQVSLSCYSTYESNGELKDGNHIGQSEVSFNAAGHITIDEWGNQYGYDAEGNFYRGNHTYTTISRDKQGHIIKYYDVEPKKDSESQLVMEFGYDKNGRLTSIVSGDGHNQIWTEKRQYKSGDIYPSKMERHSEGGEDGVAEKTSVTYRYTSFDDHNNWTERLCMVSVEKTNDVVDSFIPEQAQIKEEIQVEKRSISYFE